MRVTQREVAQAAGVSLATVSRVFSGHPHISESTREHVRTIASGIGYRPSPGISAIQTARWQTGSTPNFSRLAVVLTSDPHQRGYARAVLAPNSQFPRQAEAHGYGIETLELERFSASALRRKLEFLRVDGIVVPMASALSEATTRVLAEWPCVGMMSQTLRVPFPVVHPDELMHSHEVTERILAAGYRRTAVVIPQEPISRGVIARLGGILAAKAFLQPDLQTPLFFAGKTSMTLPEFIRHHSCDSLILYSSQHRREINLRIPRGRRFGIAALNVWDEDHETSGIQNAPEHFHERVLSLLDTMVRSSTTGASIPDLRELVRFPWQEGTTLPVVRSRASSRSSSSVVAPAEPPNRHKEAGFSG